MKKKVIETKEKTAGQLIEERTSGKQLDDATPHEISQVMLDDKFNAFMDEGIKKGRDKYGGDFFIILNLKSEKALAQYVCDGACGLIGTCTGCKMIMPIHPIPETRQTCSDPFYDQSVWHYHRGDERLEYLWTVPDIGTTKLFKDDPLNCPTDQVQLRTFVLDYLDGTLQNKANKLNEHALRSIDGRKRIIAGTDIN